jgi:hypothetical protein
VPPEIEWFANLGNKATRRAYENAIGDFMKFTGIMKPDVDPVSWTPEAYERRSPPCLNQDHLVAFARFNQIAPRTGGAPAFFVEE